MLRYLLLEKSGLLWADRVIIYDEDGLAARVGAFEDDKQVIQWISSAEELRYIYERDYRNSDINVVLVISNSSICIPIDIMRRFTVLRLGFEDGGERVLPPSLRSKLWRFGR